MATETGEEDAASNDSDEQGLCVGHARMRGSSVPDVSRNLHSFVDRGNGFVTIELESDIFEFDITLDIREAEEFLIELRDEIVRAKRKELEWETNTDPETGIVGESE